MYPDLTFQDYTTLQPGTIILWEARIFLLTTEWTYYNTNPGKQGYFQIWDLARGRLAGAIWVSDCDNNRIFEILYLKTNSLTLAKKFAKYRQQANKRK